MQVKCEEGEEVYFCGKMKLITQNILTLERAHKISLWLHFAVCLSLAFVKYGVEKNKQTVKFKWWNDCDRKRPKTLCLQHENGAH